MPLLCLVQRIEVEEESEGFPWRPLIQDITKRRIGRNSLPINAEVLFITVCQIQKEKDAKNQSLWSALDFACCISRAVFSKVTVPCWLSCESRVHASWLGPFRMPVRCRAAETRATQVLNMAQTTVNDSNVAPHLQATILHYLQPEISSLPWQQTALSARDLPRTVVPC